MKFEEFVDIRFTIVEFNNVVTGNSVVAIYLRAVVQTKILCSYVLNSRWRSV